MALQIASRFVIVCLTFLLLNFASLLLADTVVHGRKFVPDAVLRVTEQIYTQSCLTKPNVVLINGSSPGPALRLVEGRTSWIRVYNDMDDQNLTMVSNNASHLQLQFLNSSISTGMA